MRNFFSALVAFVILVVTVSGQEGRLIKTSDDLPHVGMVVGKTVCITIDRDYKSPDSRTTVCSIVNEVSEWSVGTKVGAAAHTYLQVNMTYRPVPEGRITRILYMRDHDGGGQWWAHMELHDFPAGVPWVRGLPISEMRLF